MRRIGIDIGGTFTDLVYWDDATGDRVIHKLPSTPADPAEAGLQGALELCEKAGVRPGDIDLLLHGTTVATNALLEGKGARVGLITTKGFRDVLHIGRKNRPLNFSHSQDVPRQSAPLAPRRHRRAVTERIGAPDGRVLQPLDEAEVRAAVRDLRDSGEVDAVAICCLFAFLNPAHERRIAEIVREEWPDVYACASHEIVPLYREYERFSTTALNAYVGPGTARYIERFSEGLESQGHRSDLRLMTSAGGVISAGEASHSPVSLLLSGPVGALVAGIEAGRLTGHPGVITLDVGGTSADIGVAPRGELRMKNLLDTQIGGYDAMVPMCDIGTIGAGGGSLAWIDEGGMFRVGPQSAGAVPGPACYGKGGTQPTVTDAMVVLGWYRPAALRESGLDIEPELANAAIASEIAGPLGMDTLEAAAGIVRIAVHNMAEAIRVNSVARGLDPRDFALVAYGGAGGAFAVAVARELAMRTVIVPPAAGVGAAGGLLATDLKYDRQATLWQRLDRADRDQVDAVLAELRTRATARLEQDGVDTAAIEVQFTADCRYPGQGYELRVAVPPPPITDEWCAAVAERFHRTHEQTYDRCFPDKPVMVVNLGATGIGRLPPLAVAEIAAAAAAAAPVEVLATGFPAGGGVRQLDTQFLQRQSLGAGSVVSGPAVIEQSDTTCVLDEGSRATVGRYGHLVIELEGES